MTTTTFARMRERRITWCRIDDETPQVNLITSQNYVTQCQVFQDLVNALGYTIDEVIILREEELS